MGYPLAIGITFLAFFVVGIPTFCCCKIFKIPSLVIAVAKISLVCTGVFVGFYFILKHIQFGYSLQRIWTESTFGWREQLLVVFVLLLLYTYGPTRQDYATLFSPLFVYWKRIKKLFKKEEDAGTPPPTSSSPARESRGRSANRKSRKGGKRKSRSGSEEGEHSDDDSGD